MVRKGKEEVRGGKRMTVNGNAKGVWSRCEGMELQFVCDGQNHHHCIVRRPGERKTFGFPVTWLDEGREPG